MGRESDSAPTHQEPHYQHNQQKAAHSTSDYGSTIIEAAATAQKKQQDQDDQDKVHRLIGISTLWANITVASKLWESARR
jgi:hypothetical protein